MPGICVFPSKIIKLEDASEDQVWQSLLCAVPRFIPSCDHRRFSKWRKYAIWQKIFFLRLRCLSGWQQAQRCRAASALPSPTTASSAPSGSWQPTLPAECPGHLAQTHLSLPAPPTRCLTRLGFKGPVIPLFSVVYLSETLNSHRSETYCHMGFVSFYFYNHWHLYLMDVY